MPTDVLEFYALPARERGAAKHPRQCFVAPVPVTRWNSASCVQTATRDSVRIPKAAVAIIRDVLAELAACERVALLRDDALSPERRAAGRLSRPLVVGAWTAAACQSVTSVAHRRCRRVMC